MAFANVDTLCLADEGRLWFPFTRHNELVSIKLLAVDPGTTALVLALRAAPGVELPRHRCSHAVTLYTLQGRWKYRERDWIAGPGSLLVQSAGTAHTPQVMPDCTDDAIVLVVGRGALQLLDAKDAVVGTGNWRSAVERYRAWCLANDRIADTILAKSPGDDTWLHRAASEDD